MDLINGRVDSIGVKLPSGLKFIKDKDKLKEGACICVVKNKNTGAIRFLEGSVAPVPYEKGASKECRQKYGKNLVYFIHYYSDIVVGYYQ